MHLVLGLASLLAIVSCVQSEGVFDDAESGAVEPALAGSPTAAGSAAPDGITTITQRLHMRDGVAEGHVEVS